MGKTCLNKIEGNITQGCTITQNGIKDIYLMYTDDVTPVLNLSGTRVDSVSFATGAKSYKVEGYKQNIQITTALRALDASSKLDVSISFKMPSKSIGMWRAMLTGRFYVMAVPNDGSAGAMFIGAISPLEVTASDFDSNSGAGLVTITLGAPEGSAGNYILATLAEVANTIISKSV